MLKDTSFHDYVMHDLFKDIPGVASRVMFGGWGIYKEGFIFAIIVDGGLYFKADEKSRKYFEARGSRPFIYKGRVRAPVTMPYWLAPEDVLENGDELEEWVRRSAETSKKASKKKHHV